MEFRQPRPKFLTKIQEAKEVKFFQKQSFPQIIPVGLLMPFWQTSYHFKQKKMKFVRSNPEKKQKNYKFFKNKCNCCKCFCGHVECSLDKPFHPINTFLPDIPKSTDGHRENLRKYTFFQNIFSITFFSSKTFSGHVECSLEKLFNIFSQKLENCLLKNQK